MKKLLFLIISCVALSAALADQPQTPPSSGGNIIFHPRTDHPKPRTMVECDIYGSYDFNNVIITFNTDFGNAEIVVTNTTTGESWYGGISGVGVTTIVLSGDEGYYYISVCTDRGDYSGSFII